MLDVNMLTFLSTLVINRESRGYITLSKYSIAFFSLVQICWLCDPAKNCCFACFKLQVSYGIATEIHTIKYN